jgi:hypothetical protein
MPTGTVAPINLTKLSNRLQLSLEKSDFSTVLIVNLNIYSNQLMAKSIDSSKNAGKGQKNREEHQRKVCVKNEDGTGEKSMRGEPEYYNELKEIATFSLTPTGKSGINSLSRIRSLSMSEFIERIGRGIIKLADE